MDALLPFIKTFFEALKPLSLALQDPVQMQLLIRATGRDIRFTDTELGGLLNSNGALYGVASSVAALIAEGDDLLADSNLDDKDRREQAVIELISVVTNLSQQINLLSEDIQSINLNSLNLPDELKDPQFWLELSTDLPEWLLLEYLEQEVSVVYSLLLTLGIIEEDQENDTRTLKIDELGTVFSDPVGTLKALYQWGGTQLDYEKLQDVLLSALMALDLPISLKPVRSEIANQYLTNNSNNIYELDIPIVQGITNNAFVNAGLILVPVPEHTGGPINGFLLTNLSFGDISKSIKINDSWTLTISGELDQTGVTGIRVHPGNTYPHGILGETEASISLLGQPVDDHGNQTSWLLLGGRDSTRIEVGQLELLAGFKSIGNEADLRLAALIHDIVLALTPADADSFAGALLGSLDVNTELDVDIEWSSSAGFRLGGNANLDIAIPIDKTIGPIFIDNVHLIAAKDADDITSAGSSIQTGITWSVNLGPFSILVEDMGLDLNIIKSDSNSGNLGAININVEFLPPDGAGFSVIEEQTGGVVSGGGYLSFEKDIGRYSGALSVHALSVGLSAMGVLDTRLPDKPKEWALFFSITANFPSLPLSFGFFLEGVGGIVCVNRTMDSESLAEGLIEGVLDDLMFPDDVLADAASIVQKADTYFPIAVDSYVFGPVVAIGWGKPTLIAGELGVMLSLPDGELAIIGSISTVLPDPELSLLSLNMDVLGVIDVAEQTILVAAALYDSRLLSTIELSGEMALYGRSSGTPYFLLSVGGYHPNFQPPGDLPAVLHSLARMNARIGLSEDVFIELQSYFAVTSNTVQFGAELFMEASYKFLLTVYTAKGWFNFHVLIVFSPFSIVTDIGAGIGVYANDKELMGVDLQVHLEGPEPWYASGKAEFKFFGIKVKFKIELGGKQLPELPEPFNVEAAVVKALEDSSAWSALSSNSDTEKAITLIDVNESDDDIVWARPDNLLEARQAVCPLDRDIEVYGRYVPDGAKRIDLKSAQIDGANNLPLDIKWNTLTDWFAPSQFDDLPESKKLSSPSYEEMTAGVVFGGDAVMITSNSLQEANVCSVITDWEEKIIEEEQTISRGVKPAVIGLQESLRQSSLYSGVNKTYQANRLTIRNTNLITKISGDSKFVIGKNKFSVVTSDKATAADTSTLKRANKKGLSYGRAVHLREQEIAIDNNKRSELRVSPVCAVQRETVA